MPTLPPLVTYVIAAISSLVALFATQGLIDNRWEKLISGSASILIPLGFLLYMAMVHKAHAVVKAAALNNGYSGNQANDIAHNKSVGQKGST